MNRRQALSTLTMAALVAGVGTSTLATAATKHKVVKGSYGVTAPPDPTIEVKFLAGDNVGCAATIPGAENKHTVAIPAAGLLDVVLDSPSPARAGGYGTDWDLHILDAKGNDIGSSTSGTSHEETFNTFKAKTSVTIDVCNLNGEPNATVSWTFTYKK